MPWSHCCSVNASRAPARFSRRGKRTRTLLSEKLGTKPTKMIGDLSLALRSAASSDFALNAKSKTGFSSPGISGVFDRTPLRPGRRLFPLAGAHRPREAGAGGPAPFRLAPAVLFWRYSILAQHQFPFEFCGLLSHVEKCTTERRQLKGCVGEHWDVLKVKFPRCVMRGNCTEL